MRLLKNDLRTEGTNSIDMKTVANEYPTSKRINISNETNVKMAVGIPCAQNKPGIHIHGLIRFTPADFI